MNVAALNVVLGLTVSKSTWSKGEAYINHFRRVAMGVGAVLGGKFLGKALIGFNIGIEQAKNQIAAMLAFAKQTTITDQLESANTLYDKLREKAASLPGKTSDYVDMLGKIAEPMQKANFSLEEMSDFTANAYVIAEGIGEGWRKSARDIREFIKFGKMTNQDQFLLTVLGAGGYKTDTESRKGYKKKTAAERGKMLQSSINTDTARSIGDRFGKSFKGRIETIQDTLELAAAKAGEGLSARIKEKLDKVGEWFKKNPETIKRWANTVSEALTTVFDAMEIGITWLLDHGDVVKSVLLGIGIMFGFMAGRAMAAWAAAMWPFLAASGIIYLFLKLRDAIGTVNAAIVILGGTLAGLWAYSKIKKYIGGVMEIRKEMIKLQAAAAAKSLTNTAQSVLNNGFSPNQFAMEQAKGGLKAAGQGVLGAGKAILGALPMVGIAFMAAEAANAIAGAIDGDKAVGMSALTDVMIGKLSKSDFAQMVQRQARLSTQQELYSPAIRASEINKKLGEGEQALDQWKQENQINVNINGATDPAASGEAVKQVMRQRDADMRQAQRALVGNRVRAD